MCGFPAEDKHGTRAASKADLTRFVGNFRGRKEKQEKRLGTMRPRLSHFRPRCGRFRAFLTGDKMTVQKAGWTLLTEKARWDKGLYRGHNEKNKEEFPK